MHKVEPNIQTLKMSQISVNTIKPLDAKQGIT